MEKLYFRDTEMLLPESDREKKLLLKINNTPDIDDADKRQYIYLSGFFEENIFYELSPTISPSIPTNQVVGWMPLEDMNTIVTDHTRGTLRGFINRYSYGAYIHFRFTIDGQDYRCISCEDFLLDYGRLKGYLLDDYMVVDYEDKSYGPGEGSMYTLKLQQRKN